MRAYLWIAIAAWAIIWGTSASAQVPCVPDAESEACKQCKARVASTANAATVEAIACFGGERNDGETDVKPMNCAIASSDCPQDVALYRNCLTAADEFRRSGELPELARWHDKLKRADEAAMCGEDGLPRLMARLDELRERYGMFDRDRSESYESCLRALQDEAHAKMTSFARPSGSGNALGPRAYAAAIDQALEIDKLRGLIAHREIFKLAGEIGDIAQFVEADMVFCR